MVIVSVLKDISLNRRFLINYYPKMDIIQEETFGPVLPVVEFTEVEDAIAWANDCEYGLTSSIYTQNLDMAFKLIRALKFGETL